MKVLNSFLFIFMIILFVSCNNSSNSVDTINPNPTVSSYFPVTVGTWWNYKTLVDKEFNTYSYDSTVIIANISKFDRECQMFVTFYNSDGYISTDTSYFYVDKSKVYYLMQGINSDKYSWYEFIDFETDYLQIIEYNFVDQEIAPDSLFTGVEKMERIRVGNEKLTVAGQEIDCIKYKLVDSYVGEIKVKDGEKQAYHKELYTVYNWFGENIGLVKTVYGDLEYVSDLQNYFIVK